MANSGHDRSQHLSALSARQREVLEQLARGMTNLEIADALGIGLESVKTHVSEILRRLEVDSREEAVAVWEAAQGGVFARLRRAATGFLATGLGKVALASGLTAVIVGGGLGLFAPGSRQADPPDFGLGPTATPVALPPQPLDPAGNSTTVLTAEGRPLDELLEEASYFAGFRVVLPTWLPDRYELIDVTIDHDVIRRVVLRFAPPGDLRALWVERGVLSPSPMAPPEAIEFDTGVPGVRAWRQIWPGIDREVPERGTGQARVAALAGGQFMTAASSVVDEDDLLRTLLSLAEAAPEPEPYLRPGAPPAPTPTATPTPPAPSTDIPIVALYADAAGQDLDALFATLSTHAGFEVARPKWLPDGWSIAALSTSEPNGDPNGPPFANILLRHKDELRMIAISQVPGEDWWWSERHESEAVDIGRPGVEVLHYAASSARPYYLATGRGRTTVLFDTTGLISEEDALRLLGAVIDALP